MKPHGWLFACAFLLLMAGWGRDQFDDWVNETRIPPISEAVSTEVVDRNGALLRVYPVEDGIWRLSTTPDDVDPVFLDMLLSVEDKRFFAHSGVDLLALIRAAGQAMWHGQIVSGGSTLTMQTARLMENSGTGGWMGKVRQMRLALALERRLNKAQILALYLTHAPYGGNLEGVRAASYAWFGKPPKRLAPAEAALLVALPQSPTARRPDRHPAAARMARDRVLVRVGLDPQDVQVPKTLHPFPNLAPHLSDRMRKPDDRHVQLTIDKTAQAQAQRLAQRAVQTLPVGASAAIVVVDHQSGQGLAYVGAPVFGAQTRSGYVDMVQAKRSPGSTLKPLIYALAMDQGLVHPETLIADLPVSFDGYAPQNFDGVFRGDVTVRTALEQSLNIAPVMLTKAMGPARLMGGLRRSGVQPVLSGGRPGLAIALGGIGVSLEDLAHVFAGLANSGTARPITWLSGDEQAQRRVVSAAAAWHVGHILAGIQPPDGQARGQIAFKTGTSYGHRDAWALGWDGRHVVGVWLGRPDGAPIPGIFGGDLAAPILFEMFARLKDTPDPLPVPPPNAMVLPTGLLPKPLQRFEAATGSLQDTVTVAFPPEGARLRRASDGSVLVKLRGGVPPFALLADGRPMSIGATDHSVILDGLQPGFSQLRAIDSQGESHMVSIEIE